MSASRTSLASQIRSFPRAFWMLHTIELFQLRCRTISVIAFCLFIFPITVNAGGTLGFGLGSIGGKLQALSSSDFSPAGTLFGYYNHQLSDRIDLVTGISINWKIVAEPDAPCDNASIDEKVLRVGMVYHPFEPEFSQGGFGLDNLYHNVFYLGAGPSLIYNKVTLENWGNSGLNGVVFRGNNPYNVYINNIGAHPETGSTISHSEYVFGYHLRAGIPFPPVGFYLPIAIEINYEQPFGKHVNIGGTMFSMVYSW